MSTIVFPSDRVVGDTRVRLARIGRREWINERGEPTEHIAEAAVFFGAFEAAMWLNQYTESPSLWTWEEYVEIAP